jgi:heme-degrading monooxygenase HmoA
VSQSYYTHARWKVRPGNEEEFITAWKAMGDVFLSLPGASTHGTLIPSPSDPTEVYSFGPWDSLEQIQAMRADPRAREAIQRVVGLCEEAAPGNYRVVAEMRG